MEELFDKIAKEWYNIRSTDRKHPHSAYKGGSIVCVFPGELNKRVFVEKFRDRFERKEDVIKSNFNYYVSKSGQTCYFTTINEYRNLKGIGNLNAIFFIECCSYPNFLEYPSIYFPMLKENGKAYVYDLERCMPKTLEINDRFEIIYEDHFKRIDGELKVNKQYKVKRMKELKGKLHEKEHFLEETKKLNCFNT